MHALQLLTIATWKKGGEVNPLSPSIHIQILQTNLHTLYISLKNWENLMIDQGIFSRVIILLILITYLLTVYGYC